MMRNLSTNPTPLRASQPPLADERWEHDVARDDGALRHAEPEAKQEEQASGENSKREGKGKGNEKSAATEVSVDPLQCGKPTISMTFAGTRTRGEGWGSRWVVKTPAAPLAAEGIRAAKAG